MIDHTTALTIASAAFLAGTALSMAGGTLALRYYVRSEARAHARYMEDAAAQDAMREEAIVRLKEQEKRARIAEVRLVLRELNRYAEVELEGMEMATGGRA